MPYIVCYNNINNLCIKFKGKIRNKVFEISMPIIGRICIIFIVFRGSLFFFKCFAK